MEKHMETRSPKILAAVSAIIISIAIILYLINAMEGLNRISGISGPYYDAIKALQIFEIVFAVISLHLAIATIVASFASSTNKKLSLNLLLLTFITISLEKIVTLIATFAIIKKYVSPNVYFDSSSMLTLVLFISSLICMAVAIFMFSSEKNSVGCSLGIVGSAAFSIAMIVATCIANSTNSVGVTYLIFLIFATVTSVVSFALGAKSANRVQDSSDASKVVIDNPVSPQPDNLIDHINMTNGRPDEELLKLKRLLDAGAITQEEYDKKRKKYVDKL